MNKINDASNEVSLKINLAKAKVMCSDLPEIQNVTIDNHTLEIVEEYVYIAQLLKNLALYYP